VKTTELTDTALDYAVAIAKGIPREELRLPRYKGDSLFRYTRDEDGNLDGCYVTGPDLIFSRKWEAGGPIIHKEGLGFYQANATKWWAHLPGQEYTHEGPTPLIAAMRCYVASKLGDEVDIPKECLR